jgi:hypothetical protein
MSMVQQLVDEIALREASLVDLHREREQGDIEQARFDELVAREHEALDRLRRTLAVAQADEEVAAAEAARPTGPRKRRKSLLWLAMACFLSAAGVILAHAIAIRQPGQSATGSISTTQRQQIAQLLAEAEADIANRQTTAAVAAYDSVLLIDGSNVEALTESGWLHFSAGAATHDTAAVNRGSSLLAQAVNTAPTNAAARLYYAASLSVTPGHSRDAAYQFRLFLRLHPTTAQRAVAAPFMARVGVSG